MRLLYLIPLTFIIHELSHIVVALSFTGFHYSPEYDPFTFAISVDHFNKYVASSGILSTLPLIFLVENKKHIPLFLILILIMSRWDLYKIFFT